MVLGRTGVTTWSCAAPDSDAAADSGAPEWMSPATPNPWPTHALLVGWAARGGRWLALGEDADPLLPCACAGGDAGDEGGISSWVSAPDPVRRSS